MALKVVKSMKYLYLADENGNQLGERQYGLKIENDLNKGSGERMTFVTVTFGIPTKDFELIDKDNK